MGKDDQKRDRAPNVDERLVMPDTRAEIVKGALVMTPPADEPHGTSHFDLTYVLGAHVAPGYRGAVDMLTRTSRESDFAPDASIFPIERDPTTGGRKLEELAFEIVSEQWIGVPSEKARELSRRGVRRIFCIVLKHRRVLEWSRETDGWGVCAEDAVIDDRTLAVPLPIGALLDATAADRAVVAALQARGLLVEIEERAREQGREQGREEERRQALRDLCEVLGIEIGAAQEADLARMDADCIKRLVDEIKRERRWPATR